MVLYNNKSQLDDIKYGKNISDTLGCILSASFLLLLNFVIIYDLAPNRHAGTWKLCVKELKKCIMPSFQQIL